MSRQPRFTYAHAVHHATLRCNNREFLFAVPSFELFLDILQQARRRFPLALYNYCLMTNHVHLLFKVGCGDTLPVAMHWIGSQFSRTFNRRWSRHGHLWEGRYRSTIIEAESYFFRCMTYLDLNPVRAKLAVTPLEYRWCGHRALRDEDESVLDMHPLYLAGGKTAAARYESYLKILAQDAERPAMSLATQYFAGSPRFVARMTKRFGLADRSARLMRQDVRVVGGPQLVVVGPQVGRTSGPK